MEGRVGINGQTNRSSLPRLAIARLTSTDHASPRKRPLLIFFALEGPLPAMAWTSIENGANSNAIPGIRQVMDVILSRGWTSLALTICPHKSELKKYGHHETMQFSLEIKSESVCWLSVLMVQWVMLFVALIPRVILQTSSRCTKDSYFLL
jgi:hypothetical protein